MLSLHVLPPAFELPSIDAECLAAIAYLRFTLPDGAWVLVAEAAGHGRSEFFFFFANIVLSISLRFFRGFIGITGVLP